MLTDKTNKFFTAKEEKKAATAAEHAHHPYNKEITISN